jgi:hypothetical protein
MGLGRLVVMSVGVIAEHHAAVSVLEGGAIGAQGQLQGGVVLLDLLGPTDRLLDGLSLRLLGSAAAGVKEVRGGPASGVEEVICLGFGEAADAV